MLTTHILTKNNSSTIQKTFNSIRSDNILVADLGSQDNTIKICEDHGAQVFRLNCPRNEARNFLINKTSGPTLYLEPWEILIQGQLKSEFAYATIIQQNILSKEIRAWNSNPKFVNPVYERVDVLGEESDILIYSSGRSDYTDLLQEIELWKKAHPTAIAPYYYEACTLLSLGRWQQFLNVSEHYMFLDKSQSISSIMNHYYFALAQLIHLKKAKPALQNLSLCLAAKPLMAEFWCLAGDVHYHLTKKFNIAKDLYENAMILGSKRLKNDIFPMDISKYKSYPLKMIDSCEKILNTKSFYMSK